MVSKNLSGIKDLTGLALPINVCVCGTTKKSFISSNWVLFTDTFPSSFPGINEENQGSILLVPAIIPISTLTGFNRLGKLSLVVVNC